MKTQRSNSIVSDSNDFSSKGINITAPEFVPIAKITNGLNKIEISKNENAYKHRSLPESHYTSEKSSKVSPPSRSSLPATLPTDDPSIFFSHLDQIFSKKDLLKNVHPGIENLGLNAKNDYSDVTRHFKTSCYKGLKNDDGLWYFLKRIHDIQAIDQDAASLINGWRYVSHSSIVELKMVFSSDCFEIHERKNKARLNPNACSFKPGTSVESSQSSGADSTNDIASSSRSVFLVYEYHENSVSLQDKYLIPGESFDITEPELWSFLITLSSAIQEIHSMNTSLRRQNIQLACRVIHASKILVLNGGRLKLGNVGMYDLMNYCRANPKNILTDFEQIQKDRLEDQRMLGNLLLALACRSYDRAISESDLARFRQSFSLDMNNSILALLRLKYEVNSFGRQALVQLRKEPEISDIMPFIGARFYTHLDETLKYADRIEKYARKQIESNRFFRIICKIASITERPPDMAIGSAWSETNERYLIKLLRDHLFHSVDSESRPYLNITHVTTCLTKIEMKSSDNIMLYSRGGHGNVFICTYADLNEALEMAFSELTVGDDTTLNGNGKALQFINQNYS